MVSVKCTSTRDTIWVEPTPNALLGIAGCLTPIALVHIAGRPAPIALVLIAGWSTLNGRTLYNRVSYSECPTPYSWVSYSECATPYKCALLRIDTIRSPTPYKNPTQVGTFSKTGVRQRESLKTIKSSYDLSFHRIFIINIQKIVQSDPCCPLKDSVWPYCLLKESINFHQKLVFYFCFKHLLKNLNQGQYGLTHMIQLPCCCLRKIRHITHKSLIRTNFRVAKEIFFRFY